MLLDALSRSAALCALTLAAGLVTGCGAPTQEPTSPSPTASPSETAAPTAAATSTEAPSASAQPTAAPTASAPPKPGVPIGDSSPPGVEPLTDAEKKEVATKCKKLTDAIAATAKKDGAKKRPIDYVESVLANPPTIAGTDVPRCAGLIKRDTVAYLARSRESEATINLKRVVVGLVTALEREPPAFCASAGAVPATLDAVREKPYQSTAADWAGEGWKCAAFNLVGGLQVFQYELRTNASARTFEVIARGYPVQGAAATELYIAGKVENGAIDPSMPVMRR